MDWYEPYEDEDEDYAQEEPDLGEDVESDEDKELVEYKKQWQERYSPEKPGLSPMAKIQRERILKKPGEWERLREPALSKIKEKIQTRQAIKKTKRLKEMVLCQNITSEERKMIPKDLLVSLQMPIDKENPKITQRVCYILPNLYAYLAGRYGNKPNAWSDPHTKIAYSISQQRKLETLFKKMFPCRKSFLQGTYRVEERGPKGKGYGRIQIPENLYYRLIQEERFNNSMPLILQLINSVPHRFGPRINDTHAVFVGLDEIGSHKGDTFKLDKNLMDYLGLSNGSEIWVQDCSGLPVAKKITLLPLDAKQWSSTDVGAIEDIRIGLEDYINKNYYALQVPQRLRSQWHNQDFDFELVKIEDENGNNVLSAITTKPGGHELELQFTNTRLI